MFAKKFFAYLKRNLIFSEILLNSDITRLLYVLLALIEVFFRCFEKKTKKNSFSIFFKKLLYFSCEKDCVIEKSSTIVKVARCVWFSVRVRLIVLLLCSGIEQQNCCGLIEELVRCQIRKEMKWQIHTWVYQHWETNIITVIINIIDHHRRWRWVTSTWGRAIVVPPMKHIVRLCVCARLVQGMCDYLACSLFIHYVTSFSWVVSSCVVVLECRCNY